jgi:hypothetical protein
MSNLIKAWESANFKTLLKNYHDLRITDLSISWQESLPIKYQELYFNPSLHFSIYINSTDGSYILNSYFKDTVITKTHIGNKSDPMFSVSETELDFILKSNRSAYLQRYKSFLSQKKLSLQDEYNKAMLNINIQLEQIEKNL